jgi:hypothetical protein
MQVSSFRVHPTHLSRVQAVKACAVEETQKIYGVVVRQLRNLEDVEHVAFREGAIDIRRLVDPVLAVVLGESIALLGADSRVVART